MSVKALKTASAGHYYEAGHDGQYYAKDRDSGGGIADSQWRGNLAAEIGLKGKVSAHDFQLMLNGVLPDGTQLKHSGGRQTEEGGRRAGYDFTNSMPKSFDVAGVSEKFKKDIKAIHRQANAASMKFLESKISTRVTVAKKTKKVLPNSSVIASFTHHTSRADDPNTHTHNVILNVTKAGGNIRAINGKDIYELQTQIRAKYFDAIAKGAAEKGYPIIWVQTKNGEMHPELANVTREQINAFSKRSERIAKGMDKKGVTDYETSKQVARSSRQKKSNKPLEELHKIWEKTAADIGVDFSKLKDPIQEQQMAKIEGVKEAFAKAAVKKIDGVIGRQNEADSEEKSYSKPFGKTDSFIIRASDAMKEHDDYFNAMYGNSSTEKKSSQDAVYEPIQGAAHNQGGKHVSATESFEEKLGRQVKSDQAAWDKFHGVKPESDGIFKQIAVLKKDEMAIIKSTVGEVKGFDSVSEKDGKVTISNSYFDNSQSFTIGKTLEATSSGMDSRDRGNLSKLFDGDEKKSFSGTATELLNNKGAVQGYLMKNDNGVAVGTAQSIGDGGMARGFKKFNTQSQDSEKTKINGAEFSKGRSESLGGGYSATAMLDKNGDRAAYMLSKDGKDIGALKSDALDRNMIKTQKVQAAVGGGWTDGRNAEIKIVGENSERSVKFGESKNLGGGMKATSIYDKEGNFSGSLISQDGKPESFTRDRLVTDPRIALREKFARKAEDSKSNKKSMYFKSASGGLMVRSAMHRMTGGYFGSVRKASFVEKIAHLAFKAVGGLIKFTAKGLLNAAVKDVERMVDNYRVNNLKSSGFSDKEARLMAASARASGGEGMDKFEKEINRRADAMRDAADRRDAHKETSELKDRKYGETEREPFVSEMLSESGWGESKQSESRDDLPQQVQQQENLEPVVNEYREGKQSEEDVVKEQGREKQSQPDAQEHVAESHSFVGVKNDNPENDRHVEPALDWVQDEQKQDAIGDKKPLQSIEPIRDAQEPSAEPQDSGHAYDAEQGRKKQEAKPDHKGETGQRRGLKPKDRDTAPGQDKVDFFKQSVNVQASEFLKSAQRRVQQQKRQKQQDKPVERQQVSR